MPEMVRIAAVQIYPVLMKNEDNLEAIIDKIRQAADNHAGLVVFPECSLTGYIFDSREEALPYAETIPGPSTEKITGLCKDINIHVIFGLLEKDAGRLFNAAVLIGPEGLVGVYRKNHLPYLGIDRFVDHGDRPFEVYRTPVGNIGIEICYDIIFPESSRVMALMGADILALPTNFPTGRGEMITEHVVTTRAIENRVHVVTANRIGSERGHNFSGLSKIVGASWETLALASPDKEEIIYAEVDLDKARRKHDVIMPGRHETDFIRDRRPELYGKVTGPNEGNITG